MRQGVLADYFLGVGTKLLKGTEVDPSVSRGHELQGISDFRIFLGSPIGKTRIPVMYVWISDDMDEPASLSLAGTWYNSRRDQLHRDPEYRLYYPAASEEIVYRAKAGDRLFLCQAKNGSLLAIFCPRESSTEQQLLWLFGLQCNQNYELDQVDLRIDKGRSLDIAARHVLELISVEVPTNEEQLLDRLLKKFGNLFPSTSKFSAFAREISEDVDPVSDPDAALLNWMDLEERLFRTLERYIVGERLRSGFVVDDQPDVDDFIRFSLGVQNRRKSRAGWAFGNHVEALLQAHNIGYCREATTEKRNGPDFLFPSEAAYHDLSWPSSSLRMLAIKTSCKDRWRQVLAEADRIDRKHLLTLEPGISLAQTNEMNRSNLQLVIPRSLHSSFQPGQLKEILTVADFLKLAREL